MPKKKWWQVVVKKKIKKIEGLILLCIMFVDLKGVGGPVQTILSQNIDIFSFLAMASWHLEYFHQPTYSSQPLQK